MILVQAGLANGTRVLSCDFYGSGKRGILLSRLFEDDPDISERVPQGLFFGLDKPEGSYRIKIRHATAGWDSPSGANHDSRPACGDLDGDGMAELVVGFGARGYNVIQVFDDFRNRFGEYASGAQLGGLRQIAPEILGQGGNGATRPAIGDVDGDGLGEVVIAFEGEAGCTQLKILDDSEHSFGPHPSPSLANGLLDIKSSLIPLDFDGLILPLLSDLDGDGDEDDEIVFMARDAGLPAPRFEEPDGIVPGSGVEIRIVDPIDAGEGWVYLFESQGELSPGAGARYVNYRFRLHDGDYRETYNLASGPNRERSIVSTQSYTRVFSDRWLGDGLSIKAGEATHVDILDRHKILFEEGDCSLGEEAFSREEGAFVVNKSGPIRALRSQIGAKSGPTSQRIHRFHAEREDIETRHRFHEVPGLMIIFDYSRESTGMSYFNNLGSAEEDPGSRIDGVRDRVAEGPLEWELVTGEQGSLAIVHTLESSIPGLELMSRYEDDVSPRTRQCTGDSAAFGASGAVIAGPISDTDPRTSEQTLAIRQTLYYGPPGLEIADAEQFKRWPEQPLMTEALSWREGRVGGSWGWLGGLFLLGLVLFLRRSRIRTLVQGIGD
jgi:hypothetical protein